jgi:cytosine/adenosine deaminase-related metal-dependent hydrolase
MVRFIDDRHLSLPFILQWEIASALSGSSSPTWSIDRHASHGLYLDTREVARQAWEIMRAQGYTTALLVAHPHHVARADAVCETLGMRTVVPDGLTSIDFDPDSAQRWTRSQPKWSVRETLAIAYYETVGWI